jgi:hypothetical protein
MYWVNIDIPTKRFVIHHDPECRHVLGIEKTKLKGVHTLKRDGGWLNFDTYKAVKEFHKNNFDTFELVSCCG